MKDSALYLSHWNDEKQVLVPHTVAEVLKQHHIMGIRFLYTCYKKGYKGAILNHENGMNFQLQLSAFLSALYESITVEKPVLVLCSEFAISSWNYHLATYGGFKTTVLSETNCEEIANGNLHVVIIASINDTKLTEKIKDRNYFLVVVDQFDSVANKRIFKRLRGDFDIGLTQRNFLKNRDQKLQWSMLNWTNPGVFGKLSNFIQEDTEHFLNHREPYDDYWQRLTWNFSECFVRDTDEEIEELRKNIEKSCQSKNTKTKKPKKRKRSHKTDCAESTSDASTDFNIKLEPVIKDSCIKDATEKQEAESFKDNVTCSNLAESEDYVTLPSMDENPILTSIIKNLGNPSSGSSYKEEQSSKYDYRKSCSDVYFPSTSNTAKCENKPSDFDVFTCVADYKPKETNTQSQLSYFLGNDSAADVREEKFGNRSSYLGSQVSNSSREEIMAQLFGEGDSKRSGADVKVDCAQRKEILSSLFADDL